MGRLTLSPIMPGYIKHYKTKQGQPVPGFVWKLQAVLDRFSFWKPYIMYNKFVLLLEIEYMRDQFVHGCRINWHESMW
jgi:hypothetical protein